MRGVVGATPYSQFVAVAEPETTDYRTQKAPDREGPARRAWRRYSEAVNELSRRGLLPGITEASEALARTSTINRFGFWLVWQLNGGFEGMKRMGMSDSAIWRQVKLFRDQFGEHPDDFKLPGVTIDVEEFLRWSFDPKTKKMTRRD